MSTQRSMPGGRVRRAALPKGDDGRALCRWCNLQVPPGRFTFCSDWCVEEWRIRTDPSHLRQRVLERDGGICAQCGLDCIAAMRHLKRQRGLAKAKALAHWKLAGRKSLWDADHILPVAEGGGECDLANLRTLCLRYHRQNTAELQARLTGRRGELSGS